MNDGEDGAIALCCAEKSLGEGLWRSPVIPQCVTGEPKCPPERTVLLRRFSTGLLDSRCQLLNELVDIPVLLDELGDL